MAASLRDPWLWVLMALGLLLKIPLLGLNAAEYTDGVILLGLFDNRCPFYMPLYPLLAQAVSALGLEAITAGRLVSLLAHVAAMIPLHALACHLTGSRAAGRWAAALWLVSPVPTRWGLRVMTDSLFALLWWLTLAVIVPALPRLDDRSPGLRLGRMAAWCLIFGAMAALTRQTGWILLPLGLLGLFATLHRGGKAAWGPALCLFAWAVPLAWMLINGSFSGHGGQMGERFTWRAALDTVEAYALDWPLILGWPLAILTVWGIVRPVGSGPPWRWFVAVMIWCALGILGFQVLIQSYLFRYMLPLVGFGCILGGGVLARLASERPRWITPVAVVTLAWLALITASSLWLQRQAWGDFRAGAEAMGALAGPDTRCFTNETYATWPDVGTAKAEFWSGREVKPLLAESGRLAPMPPGSLVLVSSAYGGPRAYTGLIGVLQQGAGAEIVGQWDSRLTPILPDIMDGRLLLVMDGRVELGLHQNPFAIRVRRSPQVFQTTLLRIPDAEVQP